MPTAPEQQLLRPFLGIPTNRAAGSRGLGVGARAGAEAQGVGRGLNATTQLHEPKRVPLRLEQPERTAAVEAAQGHGWQLDNLESFQTAARVKALKNVQQGQGTLAVADEMKWGYTDAIESSRQGVKNAQPTAKPEQVHHYATNKNKTYTPQFDEISNKYGLNLDDVWNKGLLPHQGRHPNAYHEYVLDSMKQFDEIAQGNKDIFLKLFENLKSNVKSNPNMLYRDYWNH